MPDNVLLLLPLLGGFVFVTFWNRTKIAAEGYQGYRLIFYSSIWGAIFLLLSLIILRIPKVGFFLKTAIAFIFGNLSTGGNDPNLTLLSFALGALAWIPLNAIFSRAREYERALKKFGSQLENRLFEALDKKTQVLITLKNRKVYIGYVLLLSDIFSERERLYITIWPMLSGYRDPDNLIIKVTNDYTETYQQLDGENLNNIRLFIENVSEVYDLSICIRIDEIVSVTGYDLDVSNSLFGEDAGLE